MPHEHLKKNKTERRQDVCPYLVIKYISHNMIYNEFHKNEKFLKFI